MKMSLAAHGNVLKRSKKSESSSHHRNTNKLYTDWIESKYKVGITAEAQLLSPGLQSNFSMTSRRSKNYDLTMEHLMRRSMKHSNFNDTSQLYNSDVSAVKKLTI